MMTEQEWTTECTTDILVSFTESLRIFTGLLTVATVCGVLSGILAASLLYVFCLKPMLLSRQGYNARRLFEPEDGEVDNNQSDCVSNSKKEVQSGTINVKDTKKQLPMNSDVAAFASRAKVVYPINQKYRPLADGASNPSLHEHAKLPSMPNDESCSSSSGESMSQEQDNDDSSQFISSSLLPKSLQNQSFTRVSHYPHTLTQPGFEGRISLYCLALQDIQQHCSQLQEEKYQIFLQIIKIIFSHRFPKDKRYAEFSTNILQMQEKGLDELKKKVSTAQNTIDRTEDQEADAPCTLEEIERAQKDLLEQSLQMTKGFSRQVEALCQYLLDRTSVVSTDEAQEIIRSLTHTLLSMEKHLSDTQEADLKRTQQRLLWWEQLMGLLQSQPALLKQEVSLRQALVARTLEQLTSDDHLTFVFMEKTLSELQAALTGAVQQCNEECIRKAKELVSDKCRKTESKRRKLQRSQLKDKSCVLGSTTHNDPQHFLKVYQELMLKHQQQSNDLELQQDDRVAEALCDLWRKLHSSWSRKLGELAKELFLNAIPAQSELPVEHCEKLWLDLEDELLSQLQQSESTTSRQLEDMRVHLDHDAQVWCEETALVLSCLRHLGEQQMKILQAMVVRQSYSLNSQVGMLIEKKHEHMIVAVQRHFVTRHFCLQVLKEMRLSKLKILSRADFRALLLEDHSKSQTPSASPKAQNKDRSASLAERHLGPERQLVDHSFQQEFLSELENGVELLQSHAQLLLGHTLSYAIWQLMASKTQTVPEKDQGWKRHLTEVASESVYVTKGSLCALVQSYYSKILNATRKLQQDQSNISREEIERQENNSQLNKALLRELANWGRKPTSTEFQQRVEVHKRRVLEQYDMEQEVMCDMLRRKKVTQDQAMDKVKEQLVEAEGAFMTELAALARVPPHCPEPEPSSQEDNTGDEGPNPNVLNLLALNPALDPALNPSLTPTIVTPAVKPMQNRKRERESQLK